MGPCDIRTLVDKGNAKEISVCDEFQKEDYPWLWDQNFCMAWVMAGAPRVHLRDMHLSLAGNMIKLSQMESGRIFQKDKTMHIYSAHF